jgi:hypothetical protein
MGFHVSISLVGYRTRKLVRGYQYLLIVVALHYLQHLLNRLEPIISIHWLHNIRKDWQLSALKISQSISRWRWCLGLCMQVDHGLLHGLKHMCLYSQLLLKNKRRGCGRLASWLLFSPLFSVLLAATRFLVLAIQSLSVDEIKNTQNNGSRGKGIVVDPQR